MVFVIVIVSLAPAARGALAYDPYLDHDLLHVAAPLDQLTPVTVAIPPAQRAAMWDWMPQYLVYTGAIMGTRDSISQFQIDQRPFRTEYRDRYLRDFLPNRPQFLIEAVGPREFALQSVVRKTCRPVFDIDGVRLFERRGFFLARSHGRSYGSAVRGICGRSRCARLPPQWAGRARSFLDLRVKSEPPDSTSFSTVAGSTLRA